MADVAVAVVTVATFAASVVFGTVLVPARSDPEIEVTVVGVDVVVVVDVDVDADVDVDVDADSVCAKRSACQKA